ncbi:hypothetical protein [Streptomyces niger]|uniref:hypothetical protein n=1 Tax=Streptomyces niger TaxID=66373 RepID=UPI00069C34E5|nr:hypothetical protein [Streptomyces niger]
MHEDALLSFLNLLTAENREWLVAQPAARQQEVAARHLEVEQGDKEAGLGPYNTVDEDVEGVSVGDLQDPAGLANAMVRQEREWQS